MLVQVKGSEQAVQLYIVLPYTYISLYAEYPGFKMNVEAEDGELVKPAWYQVKLDQISGILTMIKIDSY